MLCCVGLLALLEGLLALFIGPIGPYRAYKANRLLALLALFIGPIGPYRAYKRVCQNAN